MKLNENQAYQIKLSSQEYEAVSYGVFSDVYPYEKEWVSLNDDGVLSFTDPKRLISYILNALDYDSVRSEPKEVRALKRVAKKVEMAVSANQSEPLQENKQMKKQLDKKTLKYVLKEAFKRVKARKNLRESSFEPRRLEIEDYDELGEWWDSKTPDEKHFIAEQIGLTSLEPEYWTEADWHAIDRYDEMEGSQMGEGYDDFLSDEDAMELNLLGRGSEKEDSGYDDLEWWSSSDVKYVDTDAGEVDVAPPHGGRKKIRKRPSPHETNPKLNESIVKQDTAINRINKERREHRLSKLMKWAVK